MRPNKTNLRKPALIAAVILCALIPLMAIAVVAVLPLLQSGLVTGLVDTVSLGLAFAAMAFGLRDEQVKAAIALPNGAAAVNSPGIDLGHGSTGVGSIPDFELEIDAPALAVGELADTKTMTYDVQHDSDPAFGSPTVLADNVLVQTGAGGAGAAAATKRVSVPSDVQRYVRLVATNSGVLDASGKTATLRGVF